MTDLVARLRSGDSSAIEQAAAKLERIKAAWNETIWGRNGVNGSWMVEGLRQAIESEPK